MASSTAKFGTLKKPSRQNKNYFGFSYLLYPLVLLPRLDDRSLNVIECSLIDLIPEVGHYGSFDLVTLV